MPALKEVWVNTVPRTVDNDFIPLITSDCVPNPEVAHFTHLRLHWGCPIIPNLRALSLGPSPGQDCYRIDDVLDTWQYLCHRLETLMIDKAFPLSGDDQATKSIALPQLRGVYLVADDARVVHLLLSHIHFDPSMNIDVRICVDAGDLMSPFYNYLYQIDIGDPIPQDALFPYLVHIDDVIPHNAAYIPLLRTATRAALRDSAFECWGPEGCGHLSLAFEFGIKDYTVPRHATQFARMLRNAPITTLTLSIFRDYEEDIPDRELALPLIDFPQTITLEYYGTMTTGAHFLAELYWPTRAILPDLRVLRITLTGWSEGLLSRLSVRARAIVGLVLDDLCIALPTHSRNRSNGCANDWYQAVVAELKGLVRDTVTVEF